MSARRTPIEKEWLERRGGFIRCYACDQRVRIHPLRLDWRGPIDFYVADHDCPPRPEYLTAKEHEALSVSADLAGRLHAMVSAGSGDPRDWMHDWAEAAAAVHVIQRMIMAQAAARAYPDLYRLMGAPGLHSTEQPRGADGPGHGTT